MSKRIGNVIVIAPQPPERCDLCGAIAECRPYGPHGETICYSCGQKDEATTKRMMQRVLFGVQDS